MDAYTHTQTKRRWNIPSFLGSFLMYIGGSILAVYFGRIQTDGGCDKILLLLPAFLLPLLPPIRIHWPCSFLLTDWPGQNVRTTPFIWTVLRRTKTKKGENQFSTIQQPSTFNEILVVQTGTATQRQPNAQNARKRKRKDALHHPL